MGCCIIQFEMEKKIRQPRFYGCMTQKSLSKFCFAIYYCVLYSWYIYDALLEKLVFCCCNSIVCRKTVLFLTLQMINCKADQKVSILFFFYFITPLKFFVWMIMIKLNYQWFNLVLIGLICYSTNKLATCQLASLVLLC